MLLACSSLLLVLAMRLALLLGCTWVMRACTLVSVVA
jgi:hypothetical protein